MRLLPRSTEAKWSIPDHRGRDGGREALISWAPMMDPRIYRAAFLPALAAAIVLMFSLQPVPDPLQPPISTPEFEGRQAERLTRLILSVAPERRPGSEGDAAVAELVREHFSEIEGGELTEQVVESSHDGEDVTLPNLILTLPGTSQEVLLVLAHRDSAEGEGATTSAAATATLIELAESLGGTRHERTIVLASVSGSSDGSDSIGRLIEELPASGGITAAIAIEQPGVTRSGPPFVVPGRAEPESVNAQLLTTAVEAATKEFGHPALEGGAWEDFARLAIPTGVGDATALAGEGVEAIAVSGDGERPPPAAEDVADQISADTLTAAGSTVQDIVLTLDEAEREPEAGPTAYIEIGGNLLPGWTLAVLALTLVLPSFLAAGDVWMRDRRRSPRTARRAIPWVLERILVPLAGLLLAYGLGVVGLIDDPGYPFDPARFEGGAAAAVSFVAIGLAIFLATLLVRPMRTPLDSEPQTLASIAGLLCCLSVIGIWFVNPFLALLAAPAAHVWLLPARAAGPPGRLLIAIFALLALLPVVAAVARVGASLDLGLSAPWHLLLLTVDGQIGLPMAFLWCALLGGLLACIGAAGARIAVQPGPARVQVLGPAGHAGPGALGGTPSRTPGP